MTQPDQRRPQSAQYFKPNAREQNWQHQMVARLAPIALAWRDSGIEPDVTGVMSAGEYSAVCLVARQFAALRDPVYAFLTLDDFLQQWVLDSNGLSHLAGTTIAADPSGY